ncbi:putative Protein (DUF2974)/Lipase (class 3) [Leishmania naiffi]|uniref:Fungal lipase-type domain-containing protein n=1 Tax=Leishmania naiffi TaxID=5678 RepID=A0AAW3BBZ4_9TRYP
MPMAITLERRMPQLHSCTSLCVTTLLVSLVMLLAFPLFTSLTKKSESIITNTASLDYNATEGRKALYFCKSAYCPMENVIEWNCGSACANATPNFRVFNVYDNTSTGNFGYSGIDNDARRIVVVFRGTHNTANWIQDLDFWSIPYPNPSCGNNCRIHRGFYRAYSSVRDQLIYDVLSMLERHPSYTLFITGHSLGGAMALLAAIDFTTWNVSKPEVVDNSVQPSSAAPTPSHLAPVMLYTFGEPRVGNQYFTNWSTSVLANEKQFRITHAKDPVPHLPPLSWSYVHVPQEVWYPADDEAVLLCQDNSSTEDPLCSNSVYATRVADHLIYFGICTRCKCTAAEMEEIYKYELPPETYSVLALDYVMNRARPTVR